MEGAFNIGFRTFDPNQKENPLLVNGTKIIPMKNVKRVIDNAIPFLVLFKPTQTITNAFLAASQLGSYSYQLYDSHKKYRNTTPALQGLVSTILLVAGMIFVPKLIMLRAELLNISTKTVELIAEISNSNYKVSLKHFSSIAVSSLFYVSLYSPNPTTIAISLIAQGVFKLYEAREEFQSGNRIECGTKILLAFIKLYSAKQVIQVMIQPNTNASKRPVIVECKPGYIYFKDGEARQVAWHVILDDGSKWYVNPKWQGCNDNSPFTIEKMNEESIIKYNWPLTLGMEKGIEDREDLKKKGYSLFEHWFAVDGSNGKEYYGARMELQGKSL